MLLKMEKKDGSTQTRSSVGPCRVHSCRGYMRPNALQTRGSMIVTHTVVFGTNLMDSKLLNILITDSHRLCRVASMNNTEILEQMLKNGVNPNCWDSRKRTPLHLAASKGYAEAVK